MKNAKLSLGLLLSVFLVSACTPPDKAVVDKTTRDKIQARNNRSSNSSQRNNGSNFTLGNYALSGYLVERQIEALELAKVAMGTLEGEQKYQIDETKKDDGSISLKISTHSQQQEYETANGPWKTRANNRYEVFFQNPESQLSFKIVGRNLKTFSDDLSKEKHFVNMDEANYELALEELENNLVQIKVKSAGTFRGAKGQGIRSYATSLDIQLTVEKHGLLGKGEEVKVVNSVATVNYPGSNNRTFSVNLTGSALSLKAKLGCHELAGSFSAEAGPQKFSVEMTSEEINVNNRWKQSLASCDSRPTVDYGRLHIY